MRRWLLAVMLCCAASAVAAVELVATVDRNRIAANESLTLTLRLDARVDTDAFGVRQLNALLPDFELLGPPQAQQAYQSVNGKESQQTSWTVALLPTRSGELTIPAFTIAGATSAPIRIQVGAAAAGAMAQTLRVEMSATPDSAIEQQQVTITVRLIIPEGIGELQGGRLEIPGEELRPLAEGTHERIIDGIAQRVAEWSYAWFPKAPGPVEIPAQLFSGTQLSARRLRFDPFASAGQRVVARSPPITIDVLPRPAGVEAWLPATELTIAQIWSRPAAEIRVGEPVTRTIEIRAVGQRAAVIPPLPPIELAHARRYPDQPTLDDRADATGITGVRREAEAIVPSQAGPLALPEQRISWWNTAKGQLEVAVLPAATIMVAGPAVPDRPFAAVSPERLAQGSATVATDTDTARPWRWSTGVLAVCCLVLLGLLWRQRRPAPPAAAAARSDNETEAVAWSALQRALGAGDAAAIRDAMLAWARCRWPGAPHCTLDALAGHCGDAGLARALRDLDRTLYGAARSGYDATALASALQGLRRASPPPGRATAGELVALYPVPDSNRKGVA
jgi:hypothetical protein